jgi:hypothetical protein
LNIHRVLQQKKRVKRQARWGNYFFPLALQRFYNKPVEDISEEQLRQYWLCCQNELLLERRNTAYQLRRYSTFFCQTLVRSWNIFNDIKWKREQTLPTIKRKNGKSRHSMPWSLSEDFCDMFFPKDL